VSPNAPGVIVTGVASGETFQFVFEATGSICNTITASVLGARYV